MLATLAGEATVAVRNGAISGISLARMGSSLDDQALAAALAGGATPFETLMLAAHIERGVLTLHDAGLAGPAGGIVADGEIDLPGDTMDLHLQFRPAIPDPPTLGLRLTGPLRTPNRVAELAAVAAWRAAHTATAAPATQTP
jgi:uncharacterized protein involved in outer membrane biogenesis